MTELTFVRGICILGKLLLNISFLLLDQALSARYHTSSGTTVSVILLSYSSINKSLLYII